MLPGLLPDRERSSFDEDLQVEPRNTHLRSRQMEIHAQLVEDISSQIQLDKLPLMEVGGLSQSPISRLLLDTSKFLMQFFAACMFSRLRAPS